jgi:16S rRNA (guanine527-N7)-methyltransferase
VFHVKSIARRLDGLSARYALDQIQAERLSAFLSALVEDPRAPTAIRDAASAMDQHLADALVALDVNALMTSKAIADLGSGPGLPGIPIAIALPESQVSLLESQSRKCEFLAGAITAAELENVSVVNARAEDWPDGAACQDAVLARALAPAAVVAEYAAPLLRVGGVLVDWRGRREELEEHAALVAADHLGLELQEIRRVEPFVGARDRHLHIYRKVAPTPDRFPRRPGIARKRPLGQTIGARVGSEPAADRDQR